MVEEITELADIISDFVGDDPSGIDVYALASYLIYNGVKVIREKE